MHSLLHSFHDAWHRRHHAHHEHHAHHAMHHAMRRGDRGFAGFGDQRGFGGMHPGMDGLRRGRKLGSADLQLLLLALLAERPSHGYELIQLLEERSKGYYAPSPGMVYPALTYLEEIGYASVESDGAKKLYSVTVAGLAHLEEQRASVDALLEQLSYIGSRMEQLREAMAGADATREDDLDASHAFHGAHRGRHAGGTPELKAARRDIKAALVEKIGASVDEQRRIAKILQRAALEIRADAPEQA